MRVRRTACGTGIAALSFAIIAAGQQQPPASASSGPSAEDGQCPVPGTLEANYFLQSLTVRSVQIRHPFEFLPWIHRQVSNYKDHLEVVEGQKFQLQLHEADYQYLKSKVALHEQIAETVDNSVETSGVVPVAASLVESSLNNCSGGKIDVRYDIFSTKFAALRFAPERQKEVVNVPDRYVAVRQQAFKFDPKGAYNATNHFFGGGDIRFRPVRPVASMNAVDISGAASNAYQDANASVSGSVSPGTFGDITWQAGYVYNSRPTGQGDIGESRFNGRAIAMTRPRGDAGLLFRFGGQLEGGSVRSGYDLHSLHPGVLGGTQYAATRLFAGTAFGTQHSAIRVSGGTMLGGNGGLGAEWRKYLGDASFEGWLPLRNLKAFGDFADHRSVQLEARFSAGALSVRSGGAAPVAQRFFGGNLEQPFLEADEWDFRANPYIRSIPAQQFNATRDGPGADRFYALNLTAAPVIFRKPILPSEIVQDPGFKDTVDKGWAKIASTLAIAPLTKQQDYLDTKSKLPEVKKRLDALSTALSNVSDDSAGVRNAVDACRSKLRRASVRLVTAVKDDPAFTEEQRFGYIVILVDSRKLLPNAVDACGPALTSVVTDQNVRTASDAFGTAVTALTTAYKKIGQTAPARAAENELRYPKQVFNTIVEDLNIWSVSPVAVFDAARIFPEVSPHSGLRYGVGGGVRFTLVGHANFTVGYARNLHRHPQEGAGALFFSILITELFH